jgi:hypothetical protein
MALTKYCWRNFRLGTVAGYRKVIIKVPYRMVQGEFERLIDKNPTRRRNLVNA